jgi:hypothetical protein
MQGQHKKGYDMTPSKEEVREAYIAEIGYDPFQDDPSVTVEIAWEIVCECRVYFRQTASDFYLED